jgi:hypothetical protein
MATDNPLIAAFVSDDDDEIFICTSSDGVSWSGTRKIGQAAKGRPSLAFFNGKYWLAFRADNKTGAVLVCSSPDGVNWSDNMKIGQAAKTSPCLTVFKNQLWMAFGANDGSDRILLCSSSDGEHWSDNAVVDHESNCGPSIVEFDKKLWLAFVSSYYNDINGTGEGVGAGLLYLLTSSDGTNWINKQTGTGAAHRSMGGFFSKISPCLFVFKSQLWVAYVNPNESAHDQVVLQASSDGVQSSDRWGGGMRSRTVPVVAGFGSKLVMGFVADNSTKSLLTSTSADGKSWSTDSKIGQASDASPALAWKGN